jgi:hypothetical protein
MALITNNISGSGVPNAQIAVTGSLVIANKNDFSNLTVGSDTVFFVSGAIDGKTSGVGVSVFGGDTVISGNLTVGTGSVTITSNEVKFLGGVAKVASSSAGLTFYDSGNTSGVALSTLVAGAVVPSYFSSTTAGAIYTTGSVAFVHSEVGIDAPADKGADVFFYVSGSGSTKVALFGGNVAASGSFLAKDDITGATNASVSNSGAISGSSNLSVGGGITVHGDINSNTDTQKRLYQAAATSNVIVGGNNTTLASATGSFGMLNVSKDAVITGNLTVNGTTTTINTSNLVVKDQMILIGSGTLTSNTNGGIAIASGSNTANQALVWGRVANDTWGAGRQDVTNGSTSDLTSMNLVDIRANAFQIGNSLNKLTLAGADTVLSASSQLFLSGTNVEISLENKTGWFKLNAGVGDGFVQIQSSSVGSYGNTATIKGLNSNSLNFQGTSTVLSTVDGAFGAISSGTLGASNNVMKVQALGTTDLVVEGSTVIFAVNSGDTKIVTVNSTGMIPSADVTYDLGSAAARWRNIYTGDLHLRNERGDYTLIEEADCLTIRFNKTGKRYKFVLEPAPEFDE